MASKARHVQAAYALLQVSEFFERWAVSSAGLAVLVFGLITAWMQGWPIFGFLQGAQSNWLLVSLILWFGGLAFIGPQFQVIVLDELGFISFSSQGAQLLFQFCSTLYERVALIVTTNLQFADWVQIFQNERRRRRYWIGSLIGPLSWSSSASPTACAGRSSRRGTRSPLREGKRGR